MTPKDDAHGRRKGVPFRALSRTGALADAFEGRRHDKDFDVDEWHGTNAFIREGERIFRAYFIGNDTYGADGSSKQ